MSKTECHFRFPKKEDFVQMLVDIAVFVRPALSVIDAVWAMEGEGPAAGEPHRIGALILSGDPFAADYIAGRIIGLDWRDNPVLKCAAERGLWREEDVCLLGEPLDKIAVSDFKMPEVHEANVLIGRVPAGLVKPLSRLFWLRPQFDAQRCAGCGVCVKACPKGAIRVKSGKASLSLSGCIRCFCCSEVCPHRAVRVRKSPMLWLLKRLDKKGGASNRANP